MAGAVAYGTPRLSPIYLGQELSLSDWQCDGPLRGISPEEASPRDAIVFVSRGVFRWHRGRQSVIADPNSVLFFNADQPYRVSHPTTHGDRCVVLMPSTGVLCQTMEAVGLDHRPQSRSFPVERAYARTETLLALRAALAAARARPARDLEVDEQLVSVIGSVLRQHQTGGRRVSRDGDVPTVRRLAVERVREIAAGRFTERLSLELFAREAGYSPYHLCRLFRAETGITIARYVRRLRLLHAIEWLDQSDSLARLGLDLGFSSHSHFTTAFHNEFGLSPSQARRTLSAATLRLGLRGRRPG